MSFMEMLKEWLELREKANQPFREWGPSFDERTEDQRRMAELEAELDRRMQGEP